MPTTIEDMSEPGRELLRIPGVGRTIAARLAAVGIVDLAALAVARPETVQTALQGLPAARQRRVVAGWIDTAAAAVGPSGAPPASPGRVSFTLSVLRHRDGGVQRTIVRHLASATEEAWDGWSSERLDAFVGAYVGVPAVAPTGTIRRRDPAGSPAIGPQVEPTVEAGHVLSPGGPALVAVTLATGAQPLGGDGAVTVEVALVGHLMARGREERLARTRARLEPGAPTDVTFPVTMEPGLWRLAVAVDGEPTRPTVEVQRVSLRSMPERATSRGAATA